MVGKGDQYEEEWRVFPCTGKPSAHRLIITMFSVVQLRPSTMSPQVQI